MTTEHEERAKEIMTHFELDPTLQLTIAHRLSQTLREVERDTARRCVEIASNADTYGKRYDMKPLVQDEIATAIQNEFNLEINETLR